MNSLIKVINNLANIRRNLHAKKPVPMSVSINITGRCNLKCEFCEKGRKSSRDEIKYEDVKKLIDFSLQYDCPIFISGGEAFMHKQIWEILQYCISVGKKVSMVTNGTQFDSLSDEQFEILNNSVSMLSISLDSDNPVEHDKMRGVSGTFDKVLRFLKNPRRKNKVGINTLLYPDLRNVQSMIDLARDVKCSINFLPLIFESNFPGIEKIDWKKDMEKTAAFPQENMAKLRYLNSYAKKHKVATNLPLLMKYVDKYYQGANTDKYFFDDVSKKFMCFIPFQQLTVDEKGLIAPCVFLPGECSISDGDIYEGWLKAALKYRTLLKQGKRFRVCRCCTCHFAENFRSSIISYPYANRKHLYWLLSYYSKRFLQGEGRKW